MKKIAAIILACVTTFSSLDAVASTSDIDNLLDFTGLFTLFD